MKKSIYVFLLTLLAIFAVAIAYFMYEINEIKSPSLDIIVVNDIAQSISENWERLDLASIDNHGLEYTVLDVNNHVITQTAEKIYDNMNLAIIHRDTIVDIYEKDILLGKLVIYNDYYDSLHLHKKELFTTCVVVLSVFMAICLMFAFHIYRVIYRPFHKLQDFAKNVATGNLDIPLEMDKRNIFGAFTESFDIMRVELKAARVAEQQANKSKKELVAQLSHDIKTPIASIKAISELLSTKAIIEGQIISSDLHHLDTINQKADQINTLITNMFNATLEELQELKVEPAEQDSKCLSDIIYRADYFNKIEEIAIPECLIYADANRLTQVIDNIISNSYKYADTEIKLNSYFEDNHLILEFIDFGNGVNEDEISLLCNKFYRAKNAEGKSGTGLGLYISRYLMNKMQGDIICENTHNGFKVILILKLV